MKQQVLDIAGESSMDLLVDFDAFWDAWMGRRI